MNCFVAALAVEFAVIGKLINATPAQILISAWPEKKSSALPGFGLTMGFTVFFLSTVVLIPFAGWSYARFDFPGRISGSWPPRTAHWLPTG